MSFECTFAPNRILTKEDWQRVVSQTETDEIKASKAELETVANELVKVTRRIEVTNEAMSADDVDVATIKVLAARVAKDEAAMSILAEKRDALQASVDTATSKLAPLYSPEATLSLIQQNTPKAADIRLRLKTEIRKRVSRVELTFLPDRVHKWSEG